jgi:hypothetical protein
MKEKQTMNRRKIFLATILMTLIACQFVIAQTDRRIPERVPDIKVAPVGLPDPKLVFAGRETYQLNGQTWVRFNFKVVNFSAYPNTMFAPAPTLPACGSNASASRTWIDVVDSSNGQRVYGFCAFGQSQDLTQVWFAVKKGEERPNCVHIVMTDRKLNKVYKSNKVCLPQTGEPQTGEPPLGKADLTVKNFAFSNTLEKNVKVQIANIGDIGSAPCVLRLTVRKINGTPVGRTTEIQLPAILPNQSKTVIIDTTQILPNNVALKDTTFKLNVDITSLVIESNEANNEKWHNL